MKSIKTNNIIFIGAVLTIAAVGSIFSPSTVLGQSTGSSVVVHPSKEVMTVTPGKAVKKSLLIVNSNSAPLTLKVSVMDVRPTDQSGNVTFYQADGDYSAKTWLVPQYEIVTIPPINSKTMEYIVSVNKDMPGKGYNGAIVFNLYDSDSKKTSAESFGTFVVLNVLKNGITTGGAIKSFKNPLIQFTDPVQLEFIVKNPSNSNLSLAGDAVFTNLLGKEVGRFKTGQLDIYPKSSRNFKFQWSDAPIFGAYVATATLVDGMRKDNIVSSWTLIVFLPWAKLLLALLALAAVLIFILFLYRAYKKKRSSTMTIKDALLESAKSLPISFMASVAWVKNKAVSKIVKAKNIQNTFTE